MIGEWRLILGPIIVGAVLLRAIAGFAAPPQSRGPADMPTEILGAQISRAATNAKPLWIAGIDPGGYISATGTLRDLIQMAYRRNLLDRPLVEGGPGWIGSDLFSLNFKVAGSEMVGEDGFPRAAMAALQQLLAWRFKLSVHTEHRELPIYSLVLARSDGTLGPELRKSDVDCGQAVALMIRGVRPQSTCGFQQYVGRYVSTVLTMTDMASLFSSFLDRPVVDRTGLQGHFSATLDGIEVRPPKPFDPGYRPDDMSRAIMAMSEQLGLRLEPTMGIVDVIVVDGAADPERKETLPLLVESTRIIPADAGRGGFPYLEVTVRNVGDRTIVAAGVSTELRFTDGFVNRGGTSTDGAEYINLPRKKPLIVPPDGLYTFEPHSWPTGRSERDVVSAKAEPSFVIFDNDTAIGAEKDIRFYFKVREDNHRAWPVVDRIFAEAVARNPNPHEVLVAAQTAIEAVTDDVVRSSQAWRWAQSMLSMNLRFIRPDDAPLLNSMLDEIHTRRLANEQHYLRRK
jgi:uncharacterized protein (TIGR03435 family)